VERWHLNHDYVLQPDHLSFDETWTGHRSPLALLDLDVVKLVKVSSVSGVGESRGIFFRLRSRLRRRGAAVYIASIDCARDRGVRGEDGLCEPRVCGRV
jgi:hypothetical protein